MHDKDPECCYITFNNLLILYNKSNPISNPFKKRGTFSQLHKKGVKKRIIWVFRHPHSDGFIRISKQIHNQTTHNTASYFCY